jgi:hypothetical protein
LDDFRGANPLLLDLSYSFVCIVELSLFDFFGSEVRYHLDRIMPHQL